MSEKEIRDAIKDIEEIKHAIQKTKFKNKSSSLSKAIFALEYLISEGRDLR